jgi:ribosomal protein L40E
MSEKPDTALPNCPGCGSSSFVANPNGNPICEYCFMAYTPSKQTCPDCGTPHEPDARRCTSCGADLLRPCLACGALNSWTVPRCLVCGQEMGILGSLFERVTSTRSGWLDEVREEATELKAQQEAIADAQLAEMWEIERHRREAMARAQAERDRQQRLILTLIGIAAALCIIAVIVALVIGTPQGQSPYPLSFPAGIH